MSDTDDVNYQPLGQVLDGLGMQIHLEPGELVAGALVIVKVVAENGDVRLWDKTEGLNWIERDGVVLNLYAYATGSANVVEYGGGDDD